MRMISLAVISVVIIILVSGCVGNSDSGSNTSSSSKPKTVKTPVAKANKTAVCNETTPPGTISYLHTTIDTKSINFSWTNPSDADFNYNNIYIDGRFRINSSKNYYNLTGSAGSNHNISIRTVDKCKNINPEWINVSSSIKAILKDTTPPNQIDNLRADVEKTSINWTWDNPSNDDYAYAMVYINGVSKGSVRAPQNYYLLKGLTQDTTWTIGIRTKDKTGNINLLWSNDTETTTPDNTPPGRVSSLHSTVGRTWIYWTWTNPTDDDFAYVNVYLNGVSKISKRNVNSYNATGLKNNTEYTISIVTADTSNNINTNWVNGTETTQQ